jgi:AhpD family alkylhydroperoxidase
LVRFGHHRAAAAGPTGGPPACLHWFYTAAHPGQHRAPVPLPHQENTMTQRIDYMKQAPALFKKLVEFNMLAHQGAIEEGIRDLISVRASQINGCGFCVDMHVKEAVIHGETALRLHHLAVWRESNLFSPRERAALAWTEALTTLSPLGVPDELYEKVRTQLSEQELVDLTYEIMAINAWNRINVAFKSVPGSADKAFGLDKANLA